MRARFTVVMTLALFVGVAHVAGFLPAIVGAGVSSARYVAHVVSTGDVPNEAIPERNLDVGSGEGYAFIEMNADGSPVGWSPCDPIRIGVNPDGLPKGARKDIRKAIDTVAKASGLDLVYVGDLPDALVAPWSAAPVPGFPGWPPIVIGWVHDGHPTLSENSAGTATTHTVSSRGQPTTIVTARISVSIESDRERPGDRSRVLQHEVAHALGLDHTAAPWQVMSVGRFVGPELAEGDLEGLRLLGAQTCWKSPEPTW